MAQLAHNALILLTEPQSIFRVINLMIEHNYFLSKFVKIVTKSTWSFDNNRENDFGKKAIN